MSRRSNKLRNRLRIEKQYYQARNGALDEKKLQLGRLEDKLRRNLAMAVIIDETHRVGNEYRVCVTFTPEMFVRRNRYQMGDVGRFGQAIDTDGVALNVGEEAMRLVIGAMREFFSKDKISR